MASARPKSRPEGAVVIPTTMMPLSELKPHPRNYQTHPDDQLEHLVASIKEHGIYRNIVVAKGGTILAGHGVVNAARKMELKEVPVIQMPIDPESPQALKILAGDNEISHLAEVDDRALTELLKELASVDDLLGTGYDDKMLAALAMVTRPSAEIEDFNAAAAWVGMPAIDGTGEMPIGVMVRFSCEKDRDDFIAMVKPKTMYRASARTFSFWWPDRERDDLGAVKFTAS